MRRRLALVAAAALVAGMLSGGPAQATHNDPTLPPVLTFIDGQASVCEAAGTSCPKYEDDIWEVARLHGQWTDNAPGLFWPGVGPPASKGGWSFSAGPTFAPPDGGCASTAGVGQNDECRVSSNAPDGLRPGVSGYGVYCGSSEGNGILRFTSGDGSVRLAIQFGWRQSAGTHHILEGEVIPVDGTFTTTPSGYVGGTLVGYMNTRGAAGGGNCGITEAAQQFFVDAISVIF